MSVMAKSALLYQTESLTEHLFTLYTNAWKIWYSDLASQQSRVPGCDVQMTPTNLHPNSKVTCHSETLLTFDSQKSRSDIGEVRLGSVDDS